MKYFVVSKLSENISETPEGFLICLGVPIARTGEMEYGPGESPIKPGPDGRAIVVREAKEVFKPETIASFEGKPFTIKHPEDLVNPMNWKVLAKGVIQNVRRGTGETENDLLADILITDSEAIELVKGGIREVSCGYECEYIELGIGRGMQTNIIGNHLALVEQGRAGAGYAINDQKGAKMKKVGELIKGIFAKTGDEMAKVIDEAGLDKETKTDDDDDKGDGDKVPAWAADLQKQNKNLQAQLKKVTDAMSVGGGSQPSVMDADPEKEDKSEDADPDKESKDAYDEAPAWAKDMAKCMNSIMEKLSGAKDEDPEEESEDAESEEEEDDDFEESEEEEDDDFEESPANTKDEASRIEILAPGFKAKGKDAKRQALVKAYEATDTKEIIIRLNGGKPVDFKKISAKTVDHLFIGASEVVTMYRTKSLSALKKVRDSQQSDDGGTSVGKTAEEINEINRKHYQGAH